MRHPLARGLTGPASLFAAFAGLLVLAACEPPRDLQPDPVLQDSLGLEPTDRAHVVRLVHTQGGEAAIPDSVEIEEGDWLDFRSDDPYPRTVTFVLDSIPGAHRDFLQGQGTTSSPPLLDAGVHWAVPFEAAPPGRYPFTVSGGGRARSGVIVVLPRR